jgi:hypothetical protein
MLDEERRVSDSLSRSLTGRLVQAVVGRGLNCSTAAPSYTAPHWPLGAGCCQPWIGRIDDPGKPRRGVRASLAAWCRLLLAMDWTARSHEGWEECVLDPGLQAGQWANGNRRYTRKPSWSLAALNSLLYRISTLETCQGCTLAVGNCNLND